MSDIRWTDKIYLDSQGNIRSFDGCPTDWEVARHIIENASTVGGKDDDSQS